MYCSNACLFAFICVAGFLCIILYDKRRFIFFQTHLFLYLWEIKFVPQLFYKMFLYVSIVKIFTSLTCVTALNCVKETTFSFYTSVRIFLSLASTFIAFVNCSIRRLEMPLFRYVSIVQLHLLCWRDVYPKFCIVNVLIILVVMVVYLLDLIWSQTVSKQSNVLFFSVSAHCSRV